MSFQGKLPLTGIIVNRLEDSDTVKNAFEINGPLIERIVAVCQGPNEANRWVELLTSANPTMPIGIKRQLSNLSNKSMTGSVPQPPPHVSELNDLRFWFFIPSNSLNVGFWSYLIDLNELLRPN